MRRRQRLLRSWLRHERMTVAMLLAERERHTAQRGRRLGRSGWWVREEVHGQAPVEPTPQTAGVQHFSLDDDEPPAVKGTRPDRLPAVSGPQEQVPRRIVEQIVDIVPVHTTSHNPQPQTHNHTRTTTTTTSATTSATTTTTATATTTATTNLSRLSVGPVWSVPSAEHAAGTAMRRRERRLRQFLRHERLTVAMLLDERLARSEGWVREEVHGQVPEAPTPHRSPCTRYYSSQRERQRVRARGLAA